MKNLATAALAAAVITIFCPLDVRANPIVVDPDEFETGTAISNAFEGVVLSVEGLEVLSGSVGTDVYSISTESATTGTQLFGNLFDEVVFTQGWAQVARALRIDLTQPVESIAVDLIGRNGTVGEARAFDVAGNLISSYLTTPLFDLDYETASINRTGAPISYVLIGAQPRDTSFPTIRVDHLVYSPISVPEPGTLALLGIGLGALGVKRRRLKH